MSLNAVTTNENLSSTDRAMANLSASCQGIIDTQLAPSGSAWYGILQAELQQAQNLARQWQTQFATRLKAEVLTCVVQCGQTFAQERTKINQLFDLAATNLISSKDDLQRELTVLNTSVQLISATVASYEQNLRSGTGPDSRSDGRYDCPDSGTGSHAEVPDRFYQQQYWLIASPNHR